MIFSAFTTGEDLRAYPEAIRRALEFVSATDIEALSPGSYPIDGDKIYAKVFDLTTMALEDTHPEVHERYCDVQYWQAGSEQFGIAPDTGGNKVFSRNDEEDLILYEVVPNESFVTATPGCFAVFFPHDAHRPGIRIGAPATFRKCVVKVSVDLL